MITIIADQHAYHTPPQEAVKATEVSAYVPLRMQIRRALDLHEDLVAHVTDPVVLQWLSDLRQYPSTVLIWRTIDPMEDFIIFFGTPPSTLFPQDRIVALNLSALNRPAPGLVVDPTSWILGERLGTLWRYSNVPPHHIGQLVAWASQHENVGDPHLRALIQAQLEHWAEQHPAYGAVHAASLKEDSAKLLVRSALQRYDYRWQRMQGWGNLPLINTNELNEATITALEGYRQAIKSYWEHLFAESNRSVEVISVALEQMSGLSDAELSVLLTMINQHPATLNPDILGTIQRRFKDLPTVTEVLHELSARVAPPEPPLPDTSWTTEQWLNWTTRSYIPYFAWVIRNNQPRMHQQLCASHFSRWLYESYPAWLNSESSPLLINQYRQMREVLDTDQNAVVVWLVVDGLTWWQGELLREACERYGMYTQSHTAGVAVLPSITKISKRSLATGLPTVDLEQSIVADAARAQLARSHINGHVGYQLEESIGVLQQDKAVRCFVVLFNTIDVLAHQMTTFLDNEGIRGYLEGLARDLARMQRICMDQGRLFHALIGSDHGSTLLPPEAKSLALPQTTQEVNDSWERDVTNQEQHKPSSRAVSIGDPKQLDANQLTDWFVLDRHRYQLDQHYLVPRDYNYVKRRPTGWTHGGLTPEEVVVPLLHLSPERLTVHPVTLQISGSLRANQETVVNAVLVNPNHFPLSNLTLMLDEDIETIQIEQVLGLSKSEADVRFPANTSQATELSLQWRVKYDVFGVPHEDQGSLTLQIRRLQTQDTSFDDLFTDI